MGHDEQSPDRQPKDAADERAEEPERGPGGDLGLGDFAGLLGNPNVVEDSGRVRLRCPQLGCDQTSTAADYRRAYWPKCRRHRVRMVLVEAG
jgi:hypothetical protein